MRPANYLLCLVVLIFIGNLILGGKVSRMREVQLIRNSRAEMVVGALGLSDLVLSTEARYTRHPAVSDSIVPVMDHPGAIEHFPSGSFFRPE